MLLRSRRVKACSPVLDFGLTADLVQWHFGRHLLSRFVGRAGSGVPIRWALADVPEAPWYWERQRQLLVDSAATLFFTLAPGAFVVPWHLVVVHAGSVVGLKTNIAEGAASGVFGESFAEEFGALCDKHNMDHANRVLNVQASCMLGACC